MITLQDMSTRELIAAAQPPYYPCDDTNPVLVGTRLLPGGVPQEVYATLDELTEELKKRPHVSSKLEAKTIRRLRSQTGQTEEWLRAHPKYGQEIADAQNPNRRPVTADWAKRMMPLYGEKIFGRMFKVIQ
jgi:hypothetical protein